MSSYGGGVTQAKGDYTTAQSDDALVAAKSGYRIKVAAVYVMSQVAGEATFESGGSSVVWEVYPGDSGGAAQSAPAGEFLFGTAAGESLTVTTDITGKHFVSVLWKYVV